MIQNNIPRGAVRAGMRESMREECSGFSIIELMIIAAIVAMLSAIAVPLYAEYIEKARIIRAVSDIVNISKTITTYNMDNNRYPPSLAEVGYGTFQDPWGAPYQYLNIQTADSTGPGPKPRKDKWVHPINSDYDLYSMGQDGRSNEALTAHVSKDDVIRANDGAYIGLASDF